MRQSLDFDISFANWKSFKARPEKKEERYSESWLQHIIYRPQKIEKNRLLLLNLYYLANAATPALTGSSS